MEIRGEIPWLSASGTYVGGKTVDPTSKVCFVKWRIGSVPRKRGTKHRKHGVRNVGGRSRREEGGS